MTNFVADQTGVPYIRVGKFTCDNRDSSNNSDPASAITISYTEYEAVELDDNRIIPTGQLVSSHVITLPYPDVNDSAAMAIWNAPKPLVDMNTNQQIVIDGVPQYTTLLQAYLSSGSCIRYDQINRPA